METKKADIKELNIYQRMLRATAEINRVAKNLKVDITTTKSYKAVAEADVLEAVKPIEEEFGIYSYPVSRKVIRDEVLETVSVWNDKESRKQSQFMRVETIYRFVNVDMPSDFIEITTYGDGVDSQDKAPGKAMTYGDKYALLKAYKIQTGDDPDASASGEMRRKAKKADAPTPEQIKQAAELGINLNRLAAYLKITTDEISKDALADAIEMKQKTLAKKKATNNLQAAARETGEKHHPGEEASNG